MIFLFIFSLFLLSVFIRRTSRAMGNLSLFFVSLSAVFLIYSAFFYEPPKIENLYIEKNPVNLTDFNCMVDRSRQPNSINERHFICYFDNNKKYPPGAQIFEKTMKILNQWNRKAFGLVGKDPLSKKIYIEAF